MESRGGGRRKSNLVKEKDMSCQGGEFSFRWVARQTV